MESAASPISKRTAIAAGVLALAALAALFALDLYVFRGPNSSFGLAPWVVPVLAILVYFLLQVFAEGVMSAYWEARSRWVKVIPLFVMLIFYVAWFWLR
jgi:hypothetical protein